MPGFSESSITLNFPDGNFFRIADCPAYRGLSGYHFKEMDACWYDVVQNVYWLFELKDYSLATLDATTIDHRVWDITKKAIDSLCLFLSSKHSYPYGVQINPCLPSIPGNNTIFKFITIIHCEAAQRPNVQLINNSFRLKFKPYAELFSIMDYAVIEHSSAVTVIPHNIVS
jgi:hypothetical protein